ncbi:hypothetical protein [Paraburkholderia sp. GAS42]|uniref:hypothetical protein n=1 Tax=Paraburkholderia sp. GAS42 TaxID=3035135 RepID=UPI003D1EB4FE
MDPESFRQLRANCRRKGGHFVGFPCDWNPRVVLNPHIPGYYFTDAGAWDYIADLLDAEHPYEEIILDSPRGATAIVLLVPLPEHPQPLYIKVQLGVSNKAIGRSFHISQRY